MNPRSGRGSAVDAIVHAVDDSWTQPGVDVTFQFSHDAEDGRVKVRRAVADGVDTVLVAGGDGMVNTIGAELVGTQVALGVIPTGSGNGFARHFGIPLQVEEAVAVLARADRFAIDVGVANGRPFFVTCSMAADASLVKTFEAFPFRGIVPYVFAAAYELFDYQPQPFRLLLDDREELTIGNPLLFTVANLTQFGGGAVIAPQAQADDGQLELVVLQKQDAGRALAHVGRLFDGTLESMPGLISRSFRRLVVQREKAAAIQVDGELQESGAQVVVTLHPSRLQVLVPAREGEPGQ